MSQAKAALPPRDSGAKGKAASQALSAPEDVPGYRLGKPEEQSKPGELDKVGELEKPDELTAEDFYLENGFLVFTAAYHLRRGYCCNSGCRHCPYDGVSS